MNTGRRLGPRICLIRKPILVAIINPALSVPGIRISCSLRSRSISSISVIVLGPRDEFYSSPHVSPPWIWAPMNLGLWSDWYCSHQVSKVSLCVRFFDVLVDCEGLFSNVSSNPGCIRYTLVFCLLTSRSWEFLMNLSLKLLFRVFRLSDHTAPSWYFFPIWKKYFNVIGNSLELLVHCSEINKTVYFEDFIVLKRFRTVCYPTLTAVFIQHFPRRLILLLVSH